MKTRSRIFIGNNIRISENESRLICDETVNARFCELSELKKHSIAKSKKVSVYSQFIDVHFVKNSTEKFSIDENEDVLVYLHGEAEMDAHLDLSISEKRDTLKVEVRYTGKSFIGTALLEVYIPECVEKISVHTDSADVCGEISSKTFSCNTVSGDIEISQITAEKVIASSLSGYCCFYDMVSSFLRIKASRVELNLKKVDEMNATLLCQKGNISSTWHSIEKNGYTVSGKIEAGNKLTVDIN